MVNRGEITKNSVSARKDTLNRAEQPTRAEKWVPTAGFKFPIAFVLDLKLLAN